MRILLFFVALSISFVHGSEFDVRADVMKKVVARFAPEEYPNIAVVREVCPTTQSFTRFTKDELKFILRDSPFSADHLIAVSNIRFPDEENPRYYDEQTGVELQVFSLTYIRHRWDGLHVSYMIDSGFRKTGWNYPSDGHYHIGKFVVSFVDGIEQFQHFDFEALSPRK